MLLHHCKYFFFSFPLKDLASVDQIVIVADRFYFTSSDLLTINSICPHSVTLSSMASSFGVTVEFLDRELSRFIAANRLNCKIDKVGGIVETNRPDKKNTQYQATIKQGDALLNRIQKLSHVIDV